MQDRNKAEKWNGSGSGSITALWDTQLCNRSVVRSRIMGEGLYYHVLWLASVGGKGPIASRD